MRKMLLALFIACLMLVVPVLAQEDDENACADVDLTELKTLISDIEAAFTEGDTDTAQGLIEQVTEELYVLEQTCVPVTTSTFTSEDGGFSFEYPVDMIYEDQFGTYVFGTSQDAIDLFGGSSPEFPAGEYGFGVLLPDAMTFGSDVSLDSVEDVVNALKEIIVESNEGFSTGEVEFHGYNDRPGAIFDFDGPGFAGTIIIVQATDEQYIALVSGAHLDERDAVRDILEAVAESLRNQAE